MNKNKLMSLFIVVLAFLAVIQTGGLWLGQTKSHNLFYSTLNSFITAGSKTEKSYRPFGAKTIAIGIDNNRYVLASPESTIYSSVCKNAIDSALSDGVPTEEFPLNWNEFTGKNIILSYPFSLSSAEFLKGFSSAGRDKITLDNFDSIVITPSYSDEDIVFTFIDSSSSTISSIILDNDGINSSVCSAIDRVQGGGLTYISSAQSGFNIFKGNVFLPQWKGEEFLYSSVTVTSPYSDDDGNLSTSRLKELIQPFFEPYSADGSGVDEQGTHLFYNDDTVVKYYTNGILEYFNYAKSDEAQTLASAYDACINFIETDTAITTPIYLCAAEVTTEGLVFRFNYCVDSIPVELRDELKEELGIESAIEVVVTNNIVKKYRKYAYNFALSEGNDMTANIDFLKEINNVIMDESVNTQSLQVNNISLCYYADGTNVIGLKWKTDLDGQFFIGDTFVSVGEEETGFEFD